MRVQFVEQFCYELDKYFYARNAPNAGAVEQVNRHDVRRLPVTEHFNEAA